MSYLDYLKRNVFPGESGGDYDALFGYSNRPGGQFGGVRLTDMTVSDALNFSAPSGPYGQWVKGQVGRVATPMGAYQVVGTTLRAAKEGLGLTGNERMTPELQDRIGMWIYENQGPGAWEAWGKGGGGGSRTTTSTSGGAPMGLLNFQEQQQPQTFMERLGIQRRDPNAGGQTALPFHQRDNFSDFMGTLGASLMGLDMTTRDMAPAAMAQVENRKEKRAQKETVNRTAAWLEAQGRPDLAEAVRGGVIDGASAFTVMNQPAEARGQIVDAAQLRQMFPGATIEDGLYNLKPDGTANKIGGGGTTVNVSEPMKIMNDGRIAIADPSVEGGVRFVVPPGSPAAAAAAASDAAADQKGKNEQIYGDAAISAIDQLIGEDGTGGMIADGEGLFSLSNVGVVGNKLANLGLSQSAVDVRNTLSAVKSNIAFSRLQAMRDASVTGGALGAVTAPELDMLMNSLGAVAMDTSPQVLRENLKTIRDIWRKIQSDPVARRAYAAAGATGSTGAGAVSPQGGGFSVTEQF